MSSTTEIFVPSRHPIAHPRGGQTTLYLVRHGRTIGNVKRVLCGSTDVPLDELGVLQAARVAERIGNSIRADELVTSPLQRARFTAEAISAKTGLAPVIRPDIAEWDFGVAEGKSFEEIGAIYPEISARFQNLDDFEVGWPEGETRGQFHARVYKAFLDILDKYHEHSVIVVAHGGVFGSLLAQIRGLSPNDWRAFDIRNCSVTHLEVTVEDTAIHLMNDVEHLDGLVDPLGVTT